MNLGEKIYAAQISGDFTLDQTMPAVFISGGIGITPFRSIIKSLIDIKQNHDISLFYFARAESDFVYRDLFTTAEKENGIKVFYIVSDSKTNLEKLIMDKIPDFHSKKYYLSGPSAMVDNYKKVIRKLGIGRRQIVTDYFPGF